MDVRNKKVTIVGFGRSGSAIANLVLQLGGIVRVSDSALKEKVAEAILQANLKHDICFESDQHTKEFIKDSDVVVLSPGVRFDSKAVVWAKEEGIPCFSEIEFAWMFCKNPIIAVTGSNGKTTVSTLISQILEYAGKKTCLCGNIGSPFSQHVLSLSDGQIIVLEVSSFQLESIEKFHAHVAVLLNCTQNHLDRHKDMNDYFQAKSRIFLNQIENDYAIVNFNDLRTKNMISAICSKVIYFNDSIQLGKFPDENQNFLAARCACRVFGVSDEDAGFVLKNFRGVEHRLEWVRSIDDVEFVNDSKATTPEAGRWALERASKPIVMICGGRDKNIDFTVLRDIVKLKVKKMVVIGESKNKIRDAFSDIVDVNLEDSLEGAILKSKELSSQGDCILFSPMCTSFDMFLNFEERGKAYKEIVGNL